MPTLLDPFELSKFYQSYIEMLDRPLTEKNACYLASSTIFALRHYVIILN
jgi:hypothetical protein